MSAWLLSLLLLVGPPAPVVQPGATEDIVEQRLGKPDRVARLVLYRRSIVQWSYDSPARIVEFDAPFGERLKVVRVIAR